MPDNKDANVRRDSARPAESLPFFARFLEGQNSEGRSAESILQAAPEKRMTLKYPSDRDDIDPFLTS
jgi:hypothetical protein